MMFLTLPNCPGGPQSVPSRNSVVLVDGTKAGGTPGWECPREDQDLRPLAGVTRPAGVCVCGGNDGSPCVRGTFSTLDVAGRLLSAVPTAPPPPPPSWSYEPCWPDGPVVAEGPIGPFGALPPFFHEFLEPLEHSVLDAALDGRLMEGIPVLDPLDHLVLEMALNDGPLEEMSNLEP